jgi:hypothetical protein
MYELYLDSFVLSDSSIIGFSLIDYTNIDTLKLQNDLLNNDGGGESLNKIKSIPIDSAYLIDSLLYLNSHSNDLKSLINYDENYKNQGLKYCFSKSDSRYSFQNFLSKITLENSMIGLTGELNFNSNGERKNFKIIINKIGFNMPLRKIGIFDNSLNKIEYSNKKIQNDDKNKDLSNDQKINKKRKIKIVSILVNIVFFLRLEH